MAKTSYSLSHTKWMCKYHIIFTPKYRRKTIYYKIRRDLIEIFRHLCQYKGVEIIEGHMMPDRSKMKIYSWLLCLITRCCPFRYESCFLTGR